MQISSRRTDTSRLRGYPHRGHAMPNTPCFLTVGAVMLLRGVLGDSVIETLATADILDCQRQRRQQIRSDSRSIPATKTFTPAAGRVNALRPLRGAPNAALTRPAAGAQRANYGGNLYFCPLSEQSINHAAIKPNPRHTREQFRSQVHLFRKTFASQIVCSLLLNRTHSYSQTPLPLWCFAVPPMTRKSLSRPPIPWSSHA